MMEEFISHIPSLETATQNHQFPQKELVALDVGCGTFEYWQEFYAFLSQHRNVKYLIGIDFNSDRYPKFIGSEGKQGVMFLPGNAQKLRSILDSNSIHEQVDFITHVRPWGYVDVVSKEWDDYIKSIYSSCREVISPEGILVVLLDNVTTYSGKVEVIEEMLPEVGFEVVVSQKMNYTSGSTNLRHILSARPI